MFYDARKNVTREAVIDVDARLLRSWREVAAMQPALDAVDALLADSLALSSAE